MRVLTTLYCKLGEISTTKGTSFKQLVGLLKRMDEHIMAKVIVPVIEDLNRVARKKASMYLTQIYACLNLQKLP